MRCARCDRIDFPQVLARAPDGRLVFGWCPECLDEEGCEILDASPDPLVLTIREPLTRRLRRAARHARRSLSRDRSAKANQRLAAIGTAGLMAIWALILAFIGGWKLIGVNDGKGPWLLLGSGLMAVVSLSVWIAMIGRIGGLAFVFRVIQVAALIAAMVSLAWGLLRPGRLRAASAVTIAAVAAIVAWGAARMSVKRGRPSPSRKGRGEEEFAGLEG